MPNINYTNNVAMVTGATGYIGGNLCRALIRNGWEVHAIVRPTSNVQQLKLLGDSMHFHVIDPQETQEIVDIVGSVLPSTVFHLAATQRYEHSPADVDALLESNISLGVHVLEALCAHKVGVFINTGTYWQYSSDNEYDPLSLYAACKQAFQDLMVYYRNVRSVKCTTLLLSDTYGENDNRKKVLSLLLEAAYNGNELKLTPGEQSIDLVYLSDVVNAFLRADKVLKTMQRYEDKYTVSSGRLVSIRQLAGLIEKYVGNSIDAKWGAIPYSVRQIMRPATVAPLLPEWKAEITLEEGIRRVALTIKKIDSV